VFLITAVSGAARPPDIPIRSPSDHPIEASILNPILASPILGAAYVRPGDSQPWSPRSAKKKKTAQTKIFSRNSKNFRANQYISAQP